MFLIYVILAFSKNKIILGKITDAANAHSYSGAARNLSRWRAAGRTV